MSREAEGPAQERRAKKNDDRADGSTNRKRNGAKATKQHSALSIANGLANEPRWVAWREEEVKGKKRKIPYDPHNGHRASIPIKPSSWGSRKEAEQRWRKLDDGRRGSIGLVLGNLDADHTLMGIASTKRVASFLGQSR